MDVIVIEGGADVRALADPFALRGVRYVLAVAAVIAVGADLEEGAGASAVAASLGEVHRMRHTRFRS